MHRGGENVVISYMYMYGSARHTSNCCGDISARFFSTCLAQLRAGLGLAELDAVLALADRRTLKR